MTHSTIWFRKRWTHQWCRTTINSILLLNLRHKKKKFLNKTTTNNKSTLHKMIKNNNKQMIILSLNNYINRKNKSKETTSTPLMTWLYKKWTPLWCPTMTKPISMNKLNNSKPFKSNQHLNRQLYHKINRNSIRSNSYSINRTNRNNKRKREMNWMHSMIWHLKRWMPPWCLTITTKMKYLKQFNSLVYKKRKNPNKTFNKLLNLLMKTTSVTSTKCPHKIWAPPWSPIKINKLNM